MASLISFGAMIRCFVLTLLVLCAAHDSSHAQASRPTLHLDSTATDRGTWVYTLRAVVAEGDTLPLVNGSTGIWPSDPPSGIFAATVQGDSAVVTVVNARSSRRAVDVVYTDVRTRESVRVETIRQRPYPALTFAADPSTGQLWMAEPAAVQRYVDGAYRTDRAGVYALTATPDRLQRHPLPPRTALSAEQIQHVARRTPRDSLRAALRVTDSLLVYTIRTPDTTLVGRYARHVPSPTTGSASGDARFCGSIEDLNNTYFAFNASSPLEESHERLAENVEVLQRCPSRALRLKAHALKRETDPHALAEARAATVRDLYEQAGITPDRIHKEPGIDVRYDISNTGRQRMVASLLVAPDNR